MSAVQGLCIQNVILVASALIAILTFQRTVRQERRRATVETVRDRLKDVELIKARAVIRPFRGSPLDCFNLLRPGNEGSDLRQAILTILNSYEFMAIGLREGAFDEKTYYRLYLLTAEADFRFLFPFIEGIQTQRGKSAYSEFCRMIKRWKEHPLVVDDGNGASGRLT